MTSQGTGFRVERKFDTQVMDPRDAELRLKAHSLGFREVFPCRAVHSLYFDAEDHTFYRDHLSGHDRRMKLRFRWYGNAGQTAAEALSTTGRATLEVKARHGRAMSKPQAAVGASRTSDLVTRVFGNTDELLAWGGPLALNLIGTRPTCIVSYNRSYFEDASGAVRITLDYEMKTKLAESPSGFDADRWFPLHRRVVAELKFSLAQFDTATRAVARLPWVEIRHSKYVTAMRVLAERG